MIRSQRGRYESRNGFCCETRCFISGGRSTNAVGQNEYCRQAGASQGKRVGIRQTGTMNHYLRVHSRDEEMILILRADPALVSEPEEVELLVRRSNPDCVLRHQRRLMRRTMSVNRGSERRLSSPGITLSPSMKGAWSRKPRSSHTMALSVCPSPMNPIAISSGERYRCEEVARIAFNILSPSARLPVTANA